MSKAFVACLIVLGALALLVPATALAGGPSAGDQQYVDPLAGASHHGSSHSQTPHSSSSTSTSPAASATPATSSSPSGTSSSTSSSATSSAATNSRAHDPAKNLPMTGFNALLGALVGGCLLASGALLRRVARTG